jgi:hypothetical protein
MRFAPGTAERCSCPRSRRPRTSDPETTRSSIREIRDRSRQKRPSLEKGFQIVRGRAVKGATFFSRTPVVERRRVNLKIGQIKIYTYRYLDINNLPNLT